MIILVMILILFFHKKYFVFFLNFSGQLNDFNCLDSNVDINFNCYSNDNNGNVEMNFQFMFSSFVDIESITDFCYLIIVGVFTIYILFLC